ncbi:MAG: acyl-CoA-binding protein [Chitinophagaceae bacterium]
MSLEQQFLAAVANSKTLAEKPSNDILLQLYSLYKQATEGDTTESGPANPFDFVAKFKHEAWVKLKGLSKESAMEQYIQLIEKLQQ